MTLITIATGFTIISAIVAWTKDMDGIESFLRFAVIALMLSAGLYMERTCP